jgi:hypothetical protein
MPSQVIEAIITYTCPNTQVVVTASVTELIVEHYAGDGEFENDEDAIRIQCSSCGDPHTLKEC